MGRSGGALNKFVAATTHSFFTHAYASEEDKESKVDIYIMYMYMYMYT